MKAYMRLMSEQKSLDRISTALHINKKTAFDWRHKILRSLKQDEGVSFCGRTGKIRKSQYMDTWVKLHAYLTRS